MNVQCKNCLPEEGIEIPDFSQPEKSEIVRLTTESPIRAVKHLKDHFDLSLRDSKYIVTHINSPYGKCNRCVFDKLEEEFIHCPKCKALNFNWKNG